MANPFENMDPGFVGQLQAFIGASNGLVRPGSGWRDVQEQAALRIKNGCPDVWNSPASSCRVPTAIPGRSQHNHGFAMDLDYAEGGAEWAAQNAGRFGLHLPVDGENWHVEPIERGAEQGAVMGAASYDLVHDDPVQKPEDVLANRLNAVMGIVTGAPQAPEAPQGPEAPAAPGSAGEMQPVEEPPMPLRTETMTIPGTGGEMSGGGQQGGGGPVAEGDRLGNAGIIAAVGREMGAPDAAIKIALAAALVESNLVNVNYGDRDSLGLFQQRPSQGWGSPDQVRDPRYAARQFYSHLLGMNWQGMNPGAAAQAVQRSAYPGRYAERYGEAVSIFNQLGGR